MGFWKAVVQVRQRDVIHRKTMFYLEQLILKHNAQGSTIGVKHVHEGLDFFYAHENQARKFSDFIASVVPCRLVQSKKLISHDIHSNHFHSKYTFSVEVVPICKDDVVCLPQKLARSLGCIRQIVTVMRGGTVIRVMDSTSLQYADISSNVFWRQPFQALCSKKSLVEFIVMDIEPVPFNERPCVPGQGAVSEKFVLADCWVVRSSELGLDSSTVHCKTHLGAFLHPGDTVLGIDLQNTNVNDSNLDKLITKEGEGGVPSVILVRKVIERKRRAWKLKRMADGIEADDDPTGFEEFMDDLALDKEYRQAVNLYRDGEVDPDRASVIDGDGVTLEEMLEDLKLDDTPMAEPEA